MIGATDIGLRGQLERRLGELVIEHRDLDVAINRLGDDPAHEFHVAGIYELLTERK